MAQLQFKGKQFVQNHHLTVKFHELVPKKNKSLAKKAGLNDNLIIHGDNLKALKALLPTYGGKVKCVYIDPPYNTGNEKWKYNDNVNSPMMQEWLGKVVDREDLTRHDKWLCMMTPRLKLLRELLRDDGVIFISIDDNEQHHLRMLMDEIFGEENFVAILKWKRKKQPSYLHGHVAGVVEYVVVYARNIDDLERLSLETRNDINTRVDNSSNEISERLFQKGARVKLSDDIKKIPKGIYKSRTMQTEYLSDVFIEKGRTKNSVIIRTRFRNNQEQIEKFIDKDVLFITKNYGLRRDLLREEIEKRKSITDLLLDWGDNQESDQEISALFPEGKPFEYPKPSLLIKNIIKSLEYEEKEEFIVLDSFAGSGTTGHAVLDLNKEDNGNRKFILVEMEDYAEKITAERVRRVIKRYADAEIHPNLPLQKEGINAKEGSREIPLAPFAKGGINKKKVLVPPFEKGTNKLPPLEKGVRGIFSPTFSYFELGKPIEMESILSGKNLPTYKELARYVFYTATGEEFDEEVLSIPPLKKGVRGISENFIGESKEYKVYLFYKPDIEYLKNTALTLDRAKALGPAFAPLSHKATDGHSKAMAGKKYTGKKRLVFAPTKYLNQDHLDQLRIDFAQLPFEIYKLTE